MSAKGSLARAGIPGLESRRTRPTAVLSELENRVLLLPPTGRDSALAREILEEARIPTAACRDVEHLRSEIADGAGAVLLTEEVLTPDAIDQLAETFRSQPPWSDLPVLVFSGGEARRESLTPAVQAFTQLADITLLDRPTRKVTLVSAIRAALRARRRQYEVRGLLVELETNVRQRDQFLAMLSHELRNPLAAILASVQLMNRHGGNGHARETTVVERQTKLLSRLVDDLLDVSRVTLGKIALDVAPTDIRELVERCLHSLATSAETRGIRLGFGSDGQPFVVEGDPLRLEQIVNNLLTNAIKYTPSGGEVQVSLSCDATSGEIRVIDTGLGIDPDVLPRIFEPFTQANSTIDRSQGGLGIGLTLVKNLVHLHMGTVVAESAGPGEGSTFVVRLPRSHADAPVHRSLPPPLTSPNPQRILIVEDNADLREGLKSLLEEVGHEVLASADGEEGVMTALSQEPDVLLVDIGLPKLDGYGVAKRVRRDLARRVLLVAITGYGAPEDRRRALAAGFDEHLTKPVSLRDVLDLLARAESRRAREACL